MNRFVQPASAPSPRRRTKRPRPRPRTIALALFLGAFAACLSDEPDERSETSRTPSTEGDADGVGGDPVAAAVTLPPGSIIDTHAQLRLDRGELLGQPRWRGHVSASPVGPGRPPWSPADALPPLQQPGRQRARRCRLVSLGPLHHHALSTHHGPGQPKPAGQLRQPGRVLPGRHATPAAHPGLSGREGISHREGVLLSHRFVCHVGGGQSSAGLFQGLDQGRPDPDVWPGRQHPGGKSA